MRILILTQWFDPEPTFKGLLFARELAAHGHDVEVLTGFPNYPGGEVYPGYRIRPWRREQIDGISIIRVALYPSHDKSAFGRVLNYASFAISAALIGSALIRKPDVIYVYHPPATIGFAAVMIGFLRRAPFVYDIQDLWPDTVAVSGMMSSRTILAVLDKWCKYIYRRAWQIVVLSPGFKTQLVGRGVAPDKIHLIYNWCDETAIQPAAPDPALASRLELADRFNVMFAGTMGTGQALDSVLHAAALCRQTLPNVQFVFVGGGVERNRLEKKAGDLGLSNVRFLPRQPIGAMAAILGLADVLLVHLKADPLFSITIPSKTQAYMSSAKPLLMAVRGDAAQLVTRSGCGLVCEPENPASIAATVARFAAMSPEERRNMGQAGKRFYDEQLSLKAGVGRFEALFATICGVTISASRRPLRSAGWLPLERPRASFYERFGKRLFDLLLTLPILVLILPVMLIVGLCSILFIGRPVFFQQPRPGYLESPFTIYKFRTMREIADAQGIPLPDGKRLHPFGALLRRTSLDELPELWNVLRGHMSLVGPRPLLMRYLSFYTEEERVRFTVRPGITGWAQVNGRNEASWNDRLCRDIWYVRNQSLLLDLKILLMTAVKVVRREHVIVDARSIMMNLDEERRGMEERVAPKVGRQH